MNQNEHLDLLALAEGKAADQKEQAHLDSCPSCREELAGLQQAMGALEVFFRKASATDCPRTGEVLETILERDAPVPAGLMAHVEACPACTQALLLVRDFQAEFIPPAQTPALPPALAAKAREIQRQQVAQRTKKALEDLAAKGKKGADWVKDALGKALSPASGQAVPAAREDLTRAEEPQEEPGDRENGDKEDK